MGMMVGVGRCPGLPSCTFSIQGVLAGWPQVRTPAQNLWYR